MKTVAAAILFDGDTVLLARRASTEQLAGYWEFPGGKVEEGETLQQCLIRELQEELSLQVCVLDEIAVSEYHYGHGAIQLVALRAEIIGGQVSLTVHDAVEWVKIDQLSDYRLAPADVPIAWQLQGMMG